MDVHAFVQKTLLLLDKEREAEIEETRFLNERLSAKELQRKGVCLLKLEIKSRRHGMYGRMIAVFEPDTKIRGKDSRTELPSNNFSPGDIVGVSPMSADATEKPVVTGIISQISSFQISIAFDDSQDIFSLDDGNLFKLTKLANDVTYRRLKNTLNDLDKYRGGPCEALIEILFESRKISSPNQTLPLEFVNPSLNASQKEAVKFSLSQKEFAVIHGPPGTGKTTTVVELILQAVKQGMKVLAAAPSNIAVDNMVERLANFKQKIVRIGHPARLLEHLQKYSLDAIVSGSEEKGLARDVRTDMEKILKKMKKARTGGEKSALREEMKLLQKELYQREKAATKDVLTRADVVLVTLTSASGDGPLKHLKEDHFDLLIIDECSQALEAACWIALLRAPRCVLAGDHLQLPPTIMSKDAAASGLELSLMERVLNTFGKDVENDVVRMLTTQYRMNSDIMTWASHQLYEGRLTAHSSVADHLLRDLGEVSESEATNTSLLLIDTSGCDLYESDLAEEISKGNEGEADIVVAHVKELIKSGVKTQDIAVISPYNLQIEFLRSRLSNYLPSLEVKSVDGFQGREKEAVVISMVRSNEKGEVGFLAEKRRINVAVTRARRHLAVVCDTCTVSKNAFIKSLVDYMSEKGVVVSAHEYSQEINVTTNVSSRFSSEPKKTSKNTSKISKAKPEALVSKEEKMEKYEKIMCKFLSNEKENLMEFPSSLNSHDRMVMHEVAEKLGLFHISVGEDNNRCIKISKTKILEESSFGIGGSKCETGVSETSGDNDSEVTPESGEEIDVSLQEKIPVTPTEPVDDLPGNDTLNIDPKNEGKGVSPSCGASVSVDVSLAKQKSQTAKNDNTDLSSNVKQCPFCSKNINSGNFDLHQVHCSRQKKLQEKNTEQINVGNQNAFKSGARKKEPKVQQEKKHKDKGTSKVKTAHEVLKNIDNDDFDAMLDSIKKLDNKCAFKKCKTFTSTLGGNCEFCTLRFCLTHLMPEIHGCGDAAKVAARKVLCKEGVLYRGSGVPSHKPNPTLRSQLERKMEKKMDECSQRRTKKKKDSS